jgi:peptidylprolyl isomerase
MEKLFFKSMLLLFVPLLLTGIKNASGQEYQLSDNPIVILQTTQGDIQIRLFPDVAPKACQNFIGLIEKGYYNGVIFHRVIKGFMIQGGDPTGTGRGGESVWGGKFKDEVSSDITFDRPGLLAMANAGPNTNGSQFFITVAPTPWLNNKHTIFGEVIAGYEAVQAMENTQVGRNDRPVEDQQIFNAVIVSY